MCDLTCPDIRSLSHCCHAYNCAEPLADLVDEIKSAKYIRVLDSSFSPMANDLPEEKKSAKNSTLQPGYSILFFYEILIIYIFEQYNPIEKY